MQQEIEISPGAVITQSSDVRSNFIMKTYGHLFAAIIAFIVIEIALFKSGLAVNIAQAMAGVSWLLVLGGFMLVSWAASHVAMTVTNRAAQYAALIGFVAAEALIFVPLLFVAQIKSGASIIENAAVVSLVGFTLLTAIVFVTGRDFSFLRVLLVWGGIVAIGLIVCSLIFGFELGMIFSIAMIAFAGAAILYDTSNVLHHYPEDRYVAAALSLFASVAMLFWYVLRLFMSRD